VIRQAKQHRLVAEANARLALPVPVFALTERQEIIDRLLLEPELLAYIRQRAAELNSAEDELLTTARRYANEIGPKFSPFFYFRFAHFLARAWLNLHYRIHSLAVDESAFGRLPPDATVIFVSNHRSNFDPLLITYLASRHSTVALSAGEWARLWPLHHFVRAAGGFVVDRDAEDPLYRRVLISYVQMAVASGLHQAFFPEGELARDGRMRLPKLGFLNAYCRACREDRDIVFIPAGINYDRIPEDRRLVHATGDFGNPSAFFLVGSSLRYLASVVTLPFRRRSTRYGNASAVFGTPVSLQEWLANNDVDLAGLQKPDRYTWLPDFAADLMAACAQQIPALPVPLLATVLCQDLNRESWTFADLAADVRTLLDRLASTDARVVLPGGVDSALGAALDLLTSSKLVRHAGGDRYLVVHSGLPVLQHYANSIGHLVS
jgi:glycerol-3-phosphate O-acyltransferase